ncbi:hypothetical protein CHS0354_023946 [Potamilus streckersoni]|uniref:Toprim domain-containing protein n=1 Tax=Potamilus streckersoni TaxID=2493646 RepID=A0AAE0RZD1_9BIVA|nr:hypothetical protein CHS0354_023946 [Potamilus streckersoni]
MFIERSKIDEVRSLVDIVDVVSGYADLIPSGKLFKAKSPFKPTERTPSFFINPEKQIFTCYSTGKGGNVFSFIMEIERLSFVEAVHWVAKYGGVVLPQDSKEAQPELKEYKILRWAAQHFFTTLNQPSSKQALLYFEKRGIRHDTITSFGLGYASETWTGLLEGAKRQGFSETDLLNVGLISKSQKGGYFDTFRGRIMFPIFSNAEKIVGFAGRILNEDEKSAKYINSPETQVYQKSKLLYGLNFSRDAIRRSGEAFLVEGYMDFISLFQAGVHNVVATSGTALTHEHVSLISRYAKKISFLYDADDAGQNAMLRGIKIILPHELIPSVITLPNKHDPDSFIKEIGKDEFLKYVSFYKMSFLDFILNRLKKMGSFDIPEQIAIGIKEIVEVILLIPDFITQELFLKQLSEKTGISHSSIETEVQRQKNRHKRKIYPSRKTNTTEHCPVQATHFLAKNTPVIEITFIKYLLESLYYSTEVLDIVMSFQSSIHIQNQTVFALYEYIMAQYGKFEKSKDEAKKISMNITDEISRIEDEQLRNFASSILIEPSISPRWFSETQEEYTRRCLKSVMDSMRCLVIRQYDVSISSYLSELEKNSKLLNQVDSDVLREYNKLLRLKQGIMNEFDGLEKKMKL